MRPTILLPFALAGAALACADGEPRETATVRDSAGVEIVESSGGSWGEKGWTLDTTPVFDIGGGDGDPNQELLQVSGVVRLSDGRIAVANGGTNEVRIYGSTGAFVSSIGNTGDGPGEFRSIGMLESGAGDSLFVFDYQLRRLSVFGRDGGLGRSVTLTAAAEGQFLMPYRRLGADGWAVYAQPMHAAAGPGAEATGARRDTMRMLRVSDDLAGVTDTIAAFSGVETYLQRFGEGANAGTRFSVLPFGLNTAIAVQDGRIYIADPARYAVRVYAADGTLERIVRRPVERQPVLPADVAAARARALAETPENARRMEEEKWANAPIPKLRPAFSAMNVDGEGRLWVQDYDPDPDAPRRAAIFDPAGKLMGYVMLPGRLRVMTLEDDLVIGVWRDEDDVQHVRGYAVGR